MAFQNLFSPHYFSSFIQNCGTFRDVEPRLFPRISNHALQELLRTQAACCSQPILIITSQSRPVRDHANAGKIRLLQLIRPQRILAHTWRVSEPNSILKTWPFSTGLQLAEKI